MVTVPSVAVFIECPGQSRIVKILNKTHFAEHLFTMLFCSLTPPTMLDTIKLIFLNGTPYLSIIVSNDYEL